MKHQETLKHDREHEENRIFPLKSKFFIIHSEFDACSKRSFQSLRLRHSDYLLSYHRLSRLQLHPHES